MDELWVEPACFLYLGAIIMGSGLLYIGVVWLLTALGWDVKDRHERDQATPPPPAEGS